MICLLCIGLLCVVPMLALGIALCAGKGAQFINTMGRPMKKSFALFCGITCIIMAVGCIPLSLLEYFHSDVLLWTGLGICGVGCIALVAGACGPWFKA